MENMWRMSVGFLTILLILGTGISATHSELTSPDTKASVAQHSVIHKRSMPIEVPPQDENTNGTETLAMKSAEEQNMNNSSSTALHKEEGKEASTSTEVVTPSANTSKTTESDAEKRTLQTDDKKNKNVTLREMLGASSFDTTTDKINGTDDSITVDSERTNSTDSVANVPQKKAGVITQELQIRTMDTNNTTVTMEQVDMMHSHVSPHDDDDVPAAPNSNPETTTDTTSSSKSTQGTNPAEGVLPPEIFPNNSNVKSIENADPELRAKLNHTYYEVTTIAEETSTKDANEKKVDIITKLENGAPDLKTNAKVVQNEDEGKMIKSLHGKMKKNMSSGIIALLATITFAVVVIVAYVSMIMWRRYLERKYGRRELLVNELEFDTNDLRHFEL